MCRCEACGMERLSDLRRYLEPTTNANMSMADLLASTNPLHISDFGQEAFGARVMSDPRLSTPDRTQVLRDAHLMCAGLVKAGLHEVWWALGGLVLAGLAAAAVKTLLDQSINWWYRPSRHGLLFAAVGVPLLLVVAVACWRAARNAKENRFRSRVLPTLARALRTLHPTHNEVNATHHWLKDVVPEMHRRSRPDEIFRAVSKLPDTSLVNVNDLAPAFPELALSPDDDYFEQLRARRLGAHAQLRARRSDTLELSDDMA